MSHQTFVMRDESEVRASPLRIYDKDGHIDTVPLTIDNLTLVIPRLVAERVANELNRALGRYPD